MSDGRVDQCMDMDDMDETTNETRGIAVMTSGTIHSRI